MKRTTRKPAPKKPDFYRAPPAGPHYKPSPPRTEIINGVECVSIDASSIASLHEWYRNAGLT